MLRSKWDMYFQVLFLISVQKCVYLHCVTIIQLQKSERRLQFTKTTVGIEHWAATNYAQGERGGGDSTTSSMPTVSILKGMLFSTQD